MLPLKNKFLNTKYIVILLTGSVLFLFLSYEILGRWFTDDAFISFRYAKNFLDGHGLVFNQGEYVQGYTNFLWVIMLALLKLFHIEFTTSSILINCFSYCALSIVLFAFFKRLYNDQQNTFYVLASLSVISSPNILAWTTGGGLEGVLFLFMLTLSFYLLFYRNPVIITSLLFLLTTLIRPEGLLFFFFALIYLRFIKRTDNKTLLKFFSFYILLLAVYLLWSFIYYGSILPNTFYSKVSISLRGLQAGLHYIYRFFMSSPYLLMFLLIVLIGYETQNKEIKFFFLVSIVYIIYLAIIGGDFMFAFRFFLPVMSILFIIMMSGISQLSERIGDKNHLHGITYAILLLIIMYNIFSLSFFLSYKTEIRRYKMIGGGKILARYLNDHYPSNYTIASSGIGALGFYSNMKILDVLGLTDMQVAENGINGYDEIYSHGKSDVDYIMKRRPEIIVFGMSPGVKEPVRFAEKEIYRQRTFKKDYKYVEEVLNFDTLIFYARKDVLRK